MPWSYVHCARACPGWPQLLERMLSARDAPGRSHLAQGGAAAAQHTSARPGPRGCGSHPSCGRASAQLPRTAAAQHSVRHVAGHMGTAHAAHPQRQQRADAPQAMLQAPPLHIYRSPLHVWPRLRAPVFAIHYHLALAILRPPMAARAVLLCNCSARLCALSAMSAAPEAARAPGRHGCEGRAERARS